jgi:hypothetical protein
MPKLPGLHDRAQLSKRRVFRHAVRNGHGETVPPFESRPTPDPSDEVDEIFQERGLDPRAHDEMPFVVQSTPRRDPLVGRRNERDSGQAPRPPKEPQLLRLRPLSRYATVFGY